MLLKTILKLLLAFIWIVLLNCIIYLILNNTSSSTSELIFWGLDLLFIKNLLFSNYFNGIPFSIILSIIGFIIYVVYDYFKDNEGKSLKETIISDLGDILLGLVALWLGGSILCIISMVLHIFILLFFIPQYNRGWDIFINFYNTFYEFPEISFIIFYDFQIIDILNSLLFLIVLFHSFLLFKNKNELSESTNVELPIVQKFFLSILKNKFFQILYLFYLSPSVLVWFYPTLLSWFGLTKYKSPIQLNILTSLFLFGLLFVIFKINKKNKKVKRELLKEEIKKEVMDEINGEKKN